MAIHEQKNPQLVLDRPHIVFIRPAKVLTPCSPAELPHIRVGPGRQKLLSPSLLVKRGTMVFECAGSCKRTPTATSLYEYQHRTLPPKGWPSPCPQAAFLAKNIRMGQTASCSFRGCVSPRLASFHWSRAGARARMCCWASCG